MMVADQADPRPALAVMGQAQGLQQQGPCGGGETEEEQVGDLAKTGVETQVRGPTAKDRAGGAILDGEGLDPQRVARLRRGQGRGGVTGVHEDQALNRWRSAWPGPPPGQPTTRLVLAVGFPGAGEQVGDQGRGIRWIGQNQDGGSGRVQRC